MCLQQGYCTQPPGAYKSAAAPGGVSVVQIDAHSDLRDVYEGEALGHQSLQPGFGNQPGIHTFRRLHPLSVMFDASPPFAFRKLAYRLAGKAPTMSVASLTLAP